MASTSYNAEDIFYLLEEEDSEFPDLAMNQNTAAQTRN